MEQLIQMALEMGFSTAVPLDPAALLARRDVRAMCAADKCRAYGKNWTCPPHCGTLDACQQKMRSYRQGILLQTVGTTQKAIDTKAYRRTEQRHLQLHARLAQAMGMKPTHTPVGQIGGVFELTGKTCKLKETVPAGKVFVDGTGVGDVGSVVLRDRKQDRKSVV